MIESGTLKFFNHPIWNCFLILVGVWNLLKDPETETIWFLIGIGLLIVGIYGLYKHYKNKNTSNTKDPIDYLNERYAKGELTNDEYYSQRKDLGFE